MPNIDRRRLLRDIFPGAVAAAGLVTAGVALLPSAAQALPATIGSVNAAKAANLVENAQTVIVTPGHRRRHRRGRRWVCWWHRGRRVCGWRSW